MRLDLKFARIETVSAGNEIVGCRSFFEDGTSYGAEPRPDTPHYRVISHRLGYGDDMMRFCIEHEIYHHLAAEFLLDRPSSILWLLAHEETPHPINAAQEELLVQTCQRWANCNERPIVGGVDWDGFYLFAHEKLAKWYASSTREWVSPCGQSDSPWATLLPHGPYFSALGS